MKPVNGELNLVITVNVHLKLNATLRYFEIEDKNENT